MKTNSRIGDLFRVSTEVFLITTVVGLAKVADLKPKGYTPSSITEKKDLPRIPQPGSGTAAVITLDSVSASVDVGGRSMPIAQFITSGNQADRVILRLKGDQWKELTSLVRSSDLHFTVETDP